MAQEIIYFEPHTHRFIDRTADSFRSARLWTSRLRVIKTPVSITLIFFILFVAANLDMTSMRYRIGSLIRSDAVRIEDLSPQWVAHYGIVITNRLSRNSDADGDGLSFAQEEVFFTHPFVADTDEDGVSDGDEVTAGSNPRGEGELDTDADGLPDRWEEQYGLLTQIDDAAEDEDQDGLSNREEYRYGTDPTRTDTDGDGYPDQQEIDNGYDPDAPGDAKPSATVLIAKIGVAVPMIWSQNEEESALQKDLEKGVIRFPQTAAPGQLGNLIIAGHSSNYTWAKGDYNSILKHLGTLEAGDTIVVRTSQKNGKVADYAYRIEEKRVVRPDDPWVFESPNDRSVLTVSTCWPLGTTWHRLVLRGSLVEDGASHS